MAQTFVNKENITEIVNYIYEKIDEKLTAPSKGKVGQVLTVTENGIEWADLPTLIGNYIQEITQEGGMIKYTSTNFRTGNSDEKQINFKTINGQSVFGVDDIKI